MPLVAQGGSGEDTFVVYGNQAELRLEGDDDSDAFIVRAFALAETTPMVDQDRSADQRGDPAADHHHRGADHHQARRRATDTVQYNVNAPVSIDGGAGFEQRSRCSAPSSPTTSSSPRTASMAPACSSATTTWRWSRSTASRATTRSSRQHAVRRRHARDRRAGQRHRQRGGRCHRDDRQPRLEGRGGVINHGVTSSGDAAYDHLLAAGINLNVANPTQGPVIITRAAPHHGGRGRCGHGDERPSTATPVRRHRARAAGTKVYVTVSAARSNDDEDAADGDSVLIHHVHRAAPATTLLLRDIRQRRHARWLLPRDLRQRHADLRRQPRRGAGVRLDQLQPGAHGLSSAAAPDHAGRGRARGDDQPLGRCRHRRRRRCNGGKAATLATFDQVAVAQRRGDRLDNDAPGIVIEETNGGTLVLRTEFHHPPRSPASSTRTRSGWPRRRPQT